MDKRKTTNEIVNVYKASTPEKISVFFKSDDVIKIRVVSDSFEGMTFSSRFRKLNDTLSSERSEVFKQFLFVFEAFTSAEMAQLQDVQNLCQEVTYA